MRVSTHSGKGIGRCGHNDRSQIEPRKGDAHIDEKRSSCNYYWTFRPQMSFIEAEKAFYEEHYKNYLEAKNKSNKRHCRPQEDYMDISKKQTKETILQLGNMEDFARIIKKIKSRKITLQIYKEILQKAFFDTKQEMETKYPKFKIISVAIHLDEATPHCHMRSALIKTEKKSNEAVYEEMGVDLPMPNQKRGRFNNRQVTFDGMMRKSYMRNVARAIREYEERHPEAKEWLDELGEIEEIPLKGAKHKEKNEFILGEQERKIEKNEGILANQKTRFEEGKRKLAYLKEFNDFVEEQEAEIERSRNRGKGR